MKQSERTLLMITVATGALALAYVFAFEPALKAFDSASVSMRNRKYIYILEHKNEITERSSRVFSQGYWKNTPQEQRLSFQALIEKTARESGISRIKGIYPMPENGTERISLQLEAECTLGALTKLLYLIGCSDLPLKVRKFQIYGNTEGTGMLRTEIEVATIWIAP
jgi:hypothetical protein